MTAALTENDRAVTDLIRLNGPLSVGEMVDRLGVTATAVRQRLSRLNAQGMLDRHEYRSGRGRPVYKYTLTQKAHDSINDNFADFAKVLWTEVQNIKDESIRRTVINGVVRRLSEQYESQIVGRSVEQRLQALAQLFSDRGIPFVFEYQQELPILKIVGCPYAELTENDNEICELEQRVFSHLAKTPMTVDRGHCESGGQCCSFHPDTNHSNKQIPTAIL